MGLKPPIRHCVAPIGKSLQNRWNVELKEMNKLEMISVNIPIQYNQKKISDGKFVYFFWNIAYILNIPSYHL
jgi:hypothetical protein